ncbi:MAG: 5'/3'-nucleotidase SurE [Bacteroidaceae bacterium]|nr:5'/3'-nucleotidase SurE [Muribaculaceae bacterium]MBR6758665.1 5'/3'-nucleotidase SurE [Bacteroidaceae bacterium]
MKDRTISRGARPLILVTNDDGIEAQGIKSLVTYLMPLGDVVVVAPDSARSGQSAAITVNVPLRVTQVENQKGYVAFKTTGTPVDCVKLALNVLLSDAPDLIVSGINHGSNSGVSVVYSGTMGAVFEGIIHGIPSIGFSLCSFSHDADFSVCRNVVERLCKKALQQGLPSQLGLNVNIPATDSIQGEVVCRAARGKWVSEYESRVDPFGRPYHWLTGYFENAEPDAEDTDEYNLARNYISIVPVTPDRSLPDVDGRIAQWME